MLKFISVLHILGVVLFFGSILGHAIAGLAPAVHDSAQTQLVARQIIDVATYYLTLPGLVLLTLSGVGLVIKRERPIRNLAPHLLLATLILVNAIFILYPTGQSLLAATRDMATGTQNTNVLQDLEGREAMFGALNILLCLMATFVGVIKPGSKKEHNTQGS